MTSWGQVKEIFHRVLELPLGASFGPFVAGPDGVELYEVMMGDPRSWSDDPAIGHACHEIAAIAWMSDSGNPIGSTS